MSTATTMTESAIWGRVIRPESGDMPTEAAQYFLNLAFDQADLDQIHDLATRNQAGELTAQESEALRNFRQVGLQLDLLRSKARLALRNANGATP
jgi:hypothetical protein